MNARLRVESYCSVVLSDMHDVATLSWRPMYPSAYMYTSVQSMWHYVHPCVWAISVHASKLHNIVGCRSRLSL